MSWTRAVEGARAVVRVVRAEGFAAVRDRLWDRARDAAIRVRCVRDDRSAWPAAPVLNVIGVPMTTAFGGVPLQLRARLGRESRLRPVALLSREPRRNGRDGWRLESWTDGRPRRAMTFPAGDGDGDPLRDDPAWLHAVRTSASLVNARAIHLENADGLSLVALAALAGVDTSLSRRSRSARIERACRLESSTAAPRALFVPLAPRLPLVLSVHDLSLFRRDPHLSETLADCDQAALERADAADVAEVDEPRLDRARHHALGADVLRAVALITYPSRFMRDSVNALLARTDDRAPLRGELDADTPEPTRRPLPPALQSGDEATGSDPLSLASRSENRQRPVEPRPREAGAPSTLASSDQHDRRTHVIAPGIDISAPARRSSRRQDRIALLGGGQEHKGGRRAARLAAALVARGMSVTSYGGYGHDNLLALRRVSGVQVRGYYRAGSLSRLLAHQDASVALSLSTVPESFSLVLSEAWAAGVPVIAPATGAFVERMRAAGVHGESGLHGHAGQEHVVQEHAGDDEHGDGEHARADHAGTGGLLLSEDPSDEEILEAVDRARRMSWPALPAPPTVTQAAERHLALYRAAGWIKTVGE